MTLVKVCLDLAVLDVNSSIPNEDIDVRAVVNYYIVVPLTFSPKPIRISRPALGICPVFAGSCYSA